MSISNEENAFEAMEKLHQIGVEVVILSSSEISTETGTVRPLLIIFLSALSNFLFHCILLNTFFRQSPRPLPPPLH
jgi:pyridoxal/pyridoxine/pyridoxamine kinase